MILRLVKLGKGVVNKLNYSPYFMVKRIEFDQRGAARNIFLAIGLIIGLIGALLFFIEFSVAIKGEPIDTGRMATGIIMVIIAGFMIAIAGFPERPPRVSQEREL